MPAHLAGSQGATTSTTLLQQLDASGKTPVADSGKVCGHKANAPVAEVPSAQEARAQAETTAAAKVKQERRLASPPQHSKLDRAMTTGAPMPATSQPLASAASCSNQLTLPKTAVGQASQVSTQSAVSTAAPERAESLVGLVLSPPQREPSKTRGTSLGSQHQSAAAGMQQAAAPQPRGTPEQLVQPQRSQAATQLPSLWADVPVLPAVEAYSHLAVHRDFSNSVRFSLTTIICTLFPPRALLAELRAGFLQYAQVCILSIRNRVAQTNVPLPLQMTAAPEDVWHQRVLSLIEWLTEVHMGAVAAKQPLADSGYWCLSKVLTLARLQVHMCF